MTEVQVTFDAADDYERFMGRWSRAIGERFIAWLAPPKDASWLDVGCGTGAFTQLVLRHCAPRAIVGIDPAPAQIEHAKKQADLRQADFRVADALALPFADGAFDIVASALVLNFLPDRAKALSEMRRVTKPGGIVAGFTWERSATSEYVPYAPMLRGLVSIGGEAMHSPIVPESNPDGLRRAVQSAALADVAITQIEASQRYRDFEDYWEAQTLPFTPPGKSVAKLGAADRETLRGRMRELLPAAPDGSISYAARAVAFKARKPA